VSSLLVRGGTVVDEHDARRGDVLIADGRIADDTAQRPDQEFDATGLHVLPGVVDAHVHFNEPGRTEWEGFLRGTAAAAAGGVTTVADMPLNCHPPTLDVRALAIKRGAVAEHARVDYAFWGGVVPQSLEHLAELRDAGVVGVKAFLCDSGLAEYPPLDEFCLLDVMQRCAELGLLLALHAESPVHLGAATGMGSPIAWARSRPPRAEVEAVRMALETARVTGARLHFVHISTAEAARLVAQARGEGLDVTQETCPHYLTLDESDLERLGAVAKCAPPLRSRSTVDALWQAVVDGEVDLIASDHSPCPPAMKAVDDIWSAWGGISGVQMTLPLVLSGQRLSLPRVVQLLCANPARRLGLYPRKGALLAGSDADIAIVDLDADWTLHEQDLHSRWPLSPFVGRTLRGRVVATFVRGQLVYRDGVVLGEPGFGRAA